MREILRENVGWVVALITKLPLLLFNYILENKEEK
jgi:hypothetical protein